MPAEVSLITRIGHVRFAAALIRIAGHDFAVQPMKVIPRFDKSVRQVCQQRRVARRIAKIQIIDRIDNTDAEVIGPNTVDNRFSKVGIFRRAQPRHQRITRVTLNRNLVRFTKNPPSQDRRRDGHSLVLIIFVLGVPIVRSWWLDRLNRQFGKRNHLAIT